MIREQAYARAGLVGNPSDGYFGKTIAFAFSNFRAEVTLSESPELEIIPNARDHSVFRSVEALAEDVRLYGYYGGIRLLKATVKRFRDYCVEREIGLNGRNCTIRYETDIPHLVGLAGSSAIITACFRALMTFYEVRIPKPVLANMVLSVEKDELQIPAGLQDRVAQVYQGLVYMDFNREYMNAHGHGRYEHLDAGLLPPLYVAYRSALSQGSEVLHSDLRERFHRGEPQVLEAIAFWADLADKVRDLLVQGKGDRIGPLLNANFDRRTQVCRISEGNMRMVQAARSVGATAKFTGSGGAIIGTYEGEKMFEALKRKMESLDIRILKPVVAPPSEDGT